MIFNLCELIKAPLFYGINNPLKGHIFYGSHK